MSGVAPRWATPRTLERATFGPVVARISALMGFPLMPWQRRVVDVALEVQSEEADDPNPGSWAFQNVDVTTQRQTGKTTLLRPVVCRVAGADVNQRIFTTAQNRNKARARWMDATDAILASPLRGEVRRKVSNSFEELRWRETNSTFVPFGPNDSDMHGEVPDLVIVDELWTFDYEQALAVKGAYVPGFTTKDGQAWKFSTAGTSNSWWLNDVRARGRASVEAGNRIGTAYFEHGVPDVVDGVPIGDLSDDALIEAVLRFHPATGITVRPASVRQAFVELGRPEFMRAYANRTQDDELPGWTAVEERVYLATMTPRKIPSEETVALAFDVDPDRRDSSVSAAWRGPDGRMLTELLRRDLGTRWVGSYIVGLKERHAPSVIACNDAGPARDVADEIERAGVDILRVNAADYAASCQRHLDELKAGTWLHRGESELTAAAEATGWRKIGLSRGWHSTGSPITAWTSGTLAGWAADHAPVPAGPEPRFWMQ